VTHANAVASAGSMRPGVTLYDSPYPLLDVAYHLIRIEDLLKDVRHRDLEKMAIRNILVTHETELQFIYRHYCENGVYTCKVNITMSMIQFGKFAKECRLAPPAAPPGEVDRIFIKSNLSRDPQTGQIHAFEPENPRSCMMIHEFFEGLIRLAAGLYPEMGPLSTRVEYAVLKHILPRFSDTHKMFQ